MHLYFIVKVQFFQDIGVRDDAIGNMLVKFPPLLTYSLYKKIRPVVCSFAHRGSVLLSLCSLNVYIIYSTVPFPFPEKRRVCCLDSVDVREISVLSTL